MNKRAIGEHENIHEYFLDGRKVFTNTFLRSHFMRQYNIVLARLFIDNIVLRFVLFQTANAIQYCIELKNTWVHDKCIRNNIIMLIDIIGIVWSLD